MKATLRPQQILLSFWQHRWLIFQLAAREIAGRYRGSVFGILWSFFHPLVMLGVYTFIFSVVFQMRWGTAAQSRAEFALILFCGLILFNLFAECITRAPSLVLVNAIYVKKVQFPLEVLSWVVILSALFHFGVSFLVLLIFGVFLRATIPWTVFLAPAVVLPLVLYTAGGTWLLSSLGVFLRDIGQVIGLIVTVLLFMSPIFYPSAAVPEQFRILITANPLAVLIEEFRRVVLWGELPRWSSLVMQLALSALVAWVGFWWFQKTRKGFADVL